MTLLIYLLQGDEYTVVMDTLGSSEGVLPDQFMRKSRIVGTPGTIVAGLGHADLLLPWMDQVAEIGISDPDAVAASAQRLLPNRTSGGMLQGTAYVFGFSGGWATRFEMPSQDGFRCQRTSRMGLAIPRVEQDVVVRAVAGLDLETDDDLMVLATRVAEYVNAGKVHPTVGGDIWLTRVSVAGDIEDLNLGRIGLTAG